MKSKQFINGKIKVPPEWVGEVVEVNYPFVHLVWDATGDLMVVRVEDVEDACHSNF